MLRVSRSLFPPTWATDSTPVCHSTPKLFVLNASHKRLNLKCTWTICVYGFLRNKSEWLLSQWCEHAVICRRTHRTLYHIRRGGDSSSLLHAIKWYETPHSRNECQSVTFLELDLSIGIIILMIIILRKVWLRGRPDKVKSQWMKNQIDIEYVYQNSYGILICLYRTNRTNYQHSIECINGILSNEYEFNLSPIASIFTAELIAIYQAIVYTIQLFAEIKLSFVILLALHVLWKIPHSANYIDIKIQKMIIYDVLPMIIFVWVPSHREIPVNKTAKQSAAEQWYSLSTYIDNHNSYRKHENTLETFKWYFMGNWNHTQYTFRSIKHNAI